MPHVHTTLSAARTQLYAKLSDQTEQYWAAEELNQHIRTALRVYQALSGYRRQRITLSTANRSPFYDLHTISAFSRTIRDREVVKEIQYALLEPATGSSWTGTEQFTLAQVVGALQRRRDQFLMDTGCVVNRSVQAVTANADGRFDLPSTVIDVRRVAWGNPLPVLEERTGLPPGLTISNTGLISGTPTTAGHYTFTITVTDSLGQVATVICSISIADTVCHIVLWRDDDYSAGSFQPDWLTPATPKVYSVSTTAPISIQLIPIPSLNGSMELLTGDNGAALDPTSNDGVLLGVPDDFVWAVKFGALSDLLTITRSNDPSRARYCEQMYQLGVQAARINPSVLAARIDGQLAKTGSVFDFDAYYPGWECDYGKPRTAGLAGRNMIAFAPCPDNAYTVTLDVAGNMPVPSTDGEYLDIGKEDMDAVLGLAFHLASFKQGGMDFMQTLPVFNAFLQTDAIHRARLAASAQYRSITDGFRKLYEQQVVRAKSDQPQQGQQPIQQQALGVGGEDSGA